MLTWRKSLTKTNQTVMQLNYQFPQRNYFIITQEYSWYMYCEFILLLNALSFLLKGQGRPACDCMLVGLTSADRCWIWWCVLNAADCDKICWRSMVFSPTFRRKKVQLLSSLRRQCLGLLTREDNFIQHFIWVIPPFLLILSSKNTISQ